MAAEFSSLLLSEQFFFSQSVSFDTCRTDYGGRDHHFFLAFPFFRFTWAILVSIHGLVGFSFRLGLHFSGGTTRYFPEMLYFFSSGLASDLLIPCSAVYFFPRHLSVLSFYLSLRRIFWSSVYIDSIFAYILLYLSNDHV